MWCWSTARCTRTATSRRHPFTTQWTSRPSQTNTSNAFTSLWVDPTNVSSCSTKTLTCTTRTTFINSTKLSMKKPSSYFFIKSVINDDSEVVATPIQYVCGFTKDRHCQTQLTKVAPVTATAWRIKATTFAIASTCPTRRGRSYRQTILCRCGSRQCLDWRRTSSP